MGLHYDRPGAANMYVHTYSYVYVRTSIHTKHLLYICILLCTVDGNSIIHFNRIGVNWVHVQLLYLRTYVHMYVCAYVRSV